eukprot:CAMPEP_0198301174 /NCGR_PEP_ID=MMETSP1449-20131203/50750_1 /TAXON_ID=420275 /ORGANISM="Attheya septentrionalis, Strain CCMP2084" /LENGTH=951 /DNA_ID=CAMNT_0044003189 /DNA_START=181 /DNA_END=3036 /DNA_ORIENTATION=+
MEEKDPTELLLPAAIKEAFEAAKSGNFFTSYGIAENDVNDFSCTSALNDEDDDTLLRDKLRNFTNCVTDRLVCLQPDDDQDDSYSSLTPKKKRRKVYKYLLAQEKQELILSEIRQLLSRQRNTNNNGTTGEKSNEEGDEEGSRSVSLVSGLEDDDYGSTSISTKKSRKKSRKRKRRSKERERGEKKKKKHKKRRREKEILSEDDNNNYSEEDPDDEPLQDEPLEDDDDDDDKGPTPHLPPTSQTYQEAKEAFERKRDYELSKIPEEEKARFRKTVFVKWNKQQLGALVLSPYDVAPPVRDNYLVMAERTQKINRAMTVLIFWFGTEDFSQAYSFVPKSSITSHEAGMKQNLGSIPKRIQTKIDKGLKLTKQESQIVRGLEEMQKVSELEPEERVKYCAPEFKEEYEEQFQQEEYVDEIKEIEPAPSPEEKKEKKTKTKKEKPPKRKPGRPKKKEKKEDVEEPIPKKKVAKVKKSDDIQEDLGDPELSDIPSDDDENDDNFSDGNDVESEEEDADFEKGRKDGNRKRKSEKADGSQKKPKRKRKVDMTEEEFAEYEEERKAKKRQQEKERRERKRAEKLADSPESSPAPKKEKKPSMRERLRQEQAAFTECEREFLPIMDDLNTFVESKEADLIKSCLESLLEKLDIITPPFIREYLVGLLIKKVRTTFSDSHPEIKTLCKTVTGNMKRIFGEKDDLVPENFKPKKLVLVRKEEQKKEEQKNELKNIKKLDSHVNEKEDALESRDEVEPSKERSEPSTPAEDKKEIVDTSISVPRKNPKPVQESPAPAPIQKPARKSFSIKGLFDRPKTPVPSHKKMPLETPTSSASERISKRDTPSWVTSEGAVDSSLRDNDERLFALEFLVDASLHFPSEKYNHELIAVKIEASIFNLSKRRVNDAYWEKVHDIATALADKSRKGLLVRHILNGNFPTVDGLVKLSRKELHAYLEGGNTN